MQPSSPDTGVTNRKNKTQSPNNSLATTSAYLVHFSSCNHTLSTLNTPDGPSTLLTSMPQRSWSPRTYGQLSLIRAATRCKTTPSTLVGETIRLKAQCPLRGTPSRGLAGPDRFVRRVSGNGYSSGSSSSLIGVLARVNDIDDGRSGEVTYGSFHPT